MLSKSHRLTKKEFQDVYKKRVFFTPFFVVHVLFPTPIPTTKFSIVVSKKNAKEAVTRNFIRRKYYRILARIIKTINFPVWCIVLVNKQGMSLDDTELLGELQKAVQTTQIYAQKTKQ